jgi:hypothetical protein
MSGLRDGDVLVTGPEADALCGGVSSLEGRGPLTMMMNGVVVVDVCAVLKEKC